MADKNSLILDIDTIINKQFNIEFKGYSPIEVDQFLDSIGHDYDTYNQIIEELNEKISFYEENVSTLKSKIMELESRLKNTEEKGIPSPATTTTASLSQVDILRRLARLEQEVFNRR